LVPGPIYDLIVFSTCRQQEYEKSAAGRAAKAQMKAMKESKTSNQGGEPVLKVTIISTD
jgi:hypothetical protein